MSGKPKRFYLPYEVAARLRADAKTVCRWAKQGHLPFIRTPGGHMRLDADFVDAVASGEIQFQARTRARTDPAE